MLGFVFWSACRLQVRICPPDFGDEEDIALEMVDHPNIWTDGRVDYPTGGFEVAGSGVFFRAPEATMLEAVWCTTEEYGEALDSNCRVFMSFPGTLQSVQRAEFWGAGTASLLSLPFGH